MNTLRSPWVPLAALVGSAFVLRALLVAQGGQFFFGDEQRYERAVELYRAITAGDGAAVRTVLAQPEHALFNIVGAGLTAGQHLLAHLTPYGDWSHPENVGFTLWLGGVLLVAFSALNILWVHRLARATGAGEAEAGWAATLMAAAHSPLCYARHLLPYECALGAALGGLAIGLARATPRRALACGILGGAAMGLYNGYWFLVPVVWFAHAWWWRREANRIRLVEWCTLGTVCALALPLAVGTVAGGRAYWTTLSAFSASATQGLFAEGWSLPWQFLWDSEGFPGLAMLGSVVIAGAWARRTPNGGSARVTLWLLCLAAIYGLLVLFSTGLGRFVVYGRSVLPLVPLFALLGGWAAARLLSGRLVAQLGAAAAIAVVAVLHYRTHFALMYPRELEVAVLRQYGYPKHALTFSGSVYVPLAAPVTRPNLALVNAQFLYPLRAPRDAPVGETLLRFEHPLGLRALHYEGHTPRERALLRTHDSAMRLIRLSQPASVPDDQPPALRFQATDRSTGR